MARRTSIALPALPLSRISAIDPSRRWAGRLKAEIYALYLAYKDPRVPGAVVVGAKTERVGRPTKIAL